MKTVADIKTVASELQDLIQQVRGGDEIIVTQENKPVARIVALQDTTVTHEPLPPLRIHSFSRPQVIKPNISRAEIAEEMFER